MFLGKPLGLAVALLGAATAHAGRPPELAGFERGRAVWLGTCRLCHAQPATGAPQLGDARAWAPRVAQGKAVLYRHALDGFMGPLGDEMPPRGANADLSDDEVKAAVDYMVQASQPVKP